MLVFLDIECKHCLPLAESAPFSEMMIDGIPTQNDIFEEVTNRKQMPLATTLELVENRVYDIYQATLANISSFCYAEIRHNFVFYCIFVKYSVFRHWFDKLKCRNSNIANFCGITLYFNILAGILTV